MSPPLPKLGRSAGALTYRLVYQFILRSSYSNSQRQLLQVFNALFHPPRSPLPVGLTLNEWQQMWVHRPFHRFDQSRDRVLHTLDTLMCGRLGVLPNHAIPARSTLRSPETRWYINHTIC